MSTTVLQDEFDHHVWATIQLIDFCTPLGADKLEAGAPGTYGSILATMRHLVSTDRDYLVLITGGALPEVLEESGEMPDLRAVMVEDEAAWRELLARDPDPGTIVTRHRADGSESRVALGLRLAQVIQHGTDHRSQICTVLTAIGMEPPEIDVWSFARAVGRLEVVEAVS